MVRTRMGVALGVCALAGGALVAPGTASAEPAGSMLGSAAAPLRLTATAVRSGFESPTQVTYAPVGRRVFVVEQSGRVVAVTAKRTRTYLNLRRVVRFSGEQGLLGLAFSPRFAKDRRLYVTYTRGDGALVLARLTAKTVKAKKVKAKTLKPLLVVRHPGDTNHNGGSVAFGPDGYLYLGTGDGGGGGDPHDNARKLSSLSGKILRLDVSRKCGKRRYCIPASNPYRGVRGAKAQILHSGLRNPWRFSFDPAGRLWIGDVGQDAYEEIDVLPKGARGLDLGWPCREGLHSYDPSRCRPGATYTAPVIELAHPDRASSRAMAAQSITGGYVYRGSRYPKARGAYVFGDWVTGNVWAYQNGTLTRIGALDHVTSFGEDRAGELYAVTSGGTLYRLGL